MQAFISKLSKPKFVMNKQIKRVNSVSNNHTLPFYFFNYTHVKEGNVLFNDATNTFYLRLYDVGHMVKDHSYSVRVNPLYGLLFPISSMCSFICTI